MLVLRVIPIFLLGLLLFGCTFQVMPDKSSVRAQQRMADALEHYLENRDTRTLSSPGETQAKVPDFSGTKLWPKSTLFGVKYVRRNVVLAEGLSPQLVWWEFKLDGGILSVRISTKAPKDTLNNTLYED